VNRSTIRVLLLLLSATPVCAAQPGNDFAGTWVFRYHGQTILTLTLSARDSRIEGSVTRPKILEIDQDADVTKIGAGQETLPVTKAQVKAGKLSMTIEGDDCLMALEGPGRASLSFNWQRPPGSPLVRPWPLERAAPGEPIVLATSLRERDYSPDIQALRRELEAMVKQDQDARMKFNMSEADAIDASNRPEVLRIYERYGWVTTSLAGKDASQNFALLIQHQLPEIQQRLLPALEKAAQAGDATMNSYAYLYDRVQMGLNRPQRWGTQAICENGKPALYQVEDPSGLNARRMELFMAPVEEYLSVDYLVRSCAQSGK
jgi:Family of unknown function (DUF6624)